ncbi:MAG: hypothetical protein ACTSPY_06235 [Candidatus Helarchaeota archaeon]
MTENHNYSFFGEDTAIILLTKDFEDKLHLNFIRKKDDNTWEKFEEGLHVELKVQEICKILDFLEYNDKKMKIIHQYPESENIKTIIFKKLKDKKTKKRVLNITGESTNIPEKIYNKSLVNEEIRLFRKILEHLEMEKIAHQKS